MALAMVWIYRKKFNPDQNRIIDNNNAYADDAYLRRKRELKW
jgi:hypothetical protein